MAFADTCQFSGEDRKLLLRWLKPNWSKSAAPAYLHLRLDEDRALRCHVKPLVVKYVRAAHEDARTYFANAYGKTLDPRAAQTAFAAVRSYPAMVETLTLTGFFGEIMAGLIAELHGPHDRKWTVPVFCFRAHTNLFRELIMAAEEKRPVRRAVGRLGDDCVAFSANESGTELTAVLLCEAKCTRTHRRSMLLAGHETLSSIKLLVQIELFKIIEALKDRRGVDDERWIAAIQAFKDSPMTASNKLDMLAYTFGRKPRQADTWMSPSLKHSSHASGSPLAAVELHLEDVGNFISDVYTEAYP